MATATKEDPAELLESSTKFWLMDQLRQVLKQLREETDSEDGDSLTQAEVAERLDKDQVFISNCESGRRRIDPIELLAFARAYDVEIEEIFDRLDLQEAIDREYGPGT